MMTIMPTRTAASGSCAILRSPKATAAADSTKVVRARNIPPLGGVETLMSRLSSRKKRRAYHTRFPLPLLPSGPGGVHVALSVDHRGGLTFRTATLPYGAERVETRVAARLSFLAARPARLLLVF